MGTAATSQVIGEALGLSLPHSALSPSGSAVWRDLARRSALDRRMKINAMPGEPGFIVDGINCPMLVKALAGAYHFAKKGDKTSPTPNKVHPWADIAESEQYAVLGHDGLGSAVAGFIHEGAGARDGGDYRAILMD
jgi:hypothetical protein